MVLAATERDQGEKFLNASGSGPSLPEEFDVNIPLFIAWKVPIAIASSKYLFGLCLPKVILYQHHSYCIIKCRQNVSIVTAISPTVCTPQCVMMVPPLEPFQGQNQKGLSCQVSSLLPLMQCVPCPI